MASSSGNSSQPKRPSFLSSFSRTFSSSSGASPAAVPTSGDDQVHQDQQPPQNNRLKTLVKTLTWVGTKVAETVDYVGEGVVSVLGLDDSRFQDVLDNMTEEEREQAEAVHAQRQQEYRDAGLLIDESIPSEDAVVAEICTVSSNGNSVKVVDVEVGGDVVTDANDGGGVELSCSSVNAKQNQSSSDVVDAKDVVVSTAENNV